MATHLNSIESNSAAIGRAGPRPVWTPPVAEDSVVGDLCTVAHHVAHVREELRRHEIAEAAYYLAQKRGFAPGHEEEDWRAAEQQIRNILCEDL